MWSGRAGRSRKVKKRTGLMIDPKEGAWIRRKK
jgi:hypothetical protein